MNSAKSSDLHISSSKFLYSPLATDPKNKYIIDFVIGGRDDEALEELFKKLERFRGKVLLVLVDGYHGYEKFIRKYLGLKS
ncbi:MAG: hypothetical protein SVY15_08395 [Halobacteriota archaeon]|nr:hypothetical protein [Halobacteriota archaeon]